MRRMAALAAAIVLGTACAVVVSAAPAAAAQKCHDALTSDPSPTGGRANACRTWFASGGAYYGEVWGELIDLDTDDYSVLFQERRDGVVRTMARTNGAYSGTRKSFSYSYTNVGALYNRVCLVIYGQTTPAVNCSPWW